MTRKTALVFGIGASLILAAGTASADCASEVRSLQQQIGAIDMPESTGTSATGSTTMESGSATSGTSETGTADNPTWSSSDPGEPASPDEQVTSGTTDSSETMTGTSETGSAVNPTWSSNDPGEPAEHDQQVTSGETSGDITGTTGTGTITETTRTGELGEPADSRSAALASLKKAQLYADAGQEDACMSELSVAKQHMGVD